MAPHSQITLYSLQASRSIRIAFLLEELGLAYENHSFERLPSMKAPEEFRKQARSAIGKAPVLWDGELCVVESGAITEYLLGKYDKNNILSGQSLSPARSRIQTFIHAAEGTFMVHCLAITYARAFAPETLKSSDALLEMERGMAVNVGKDLDWLEGELKRNAEEVGGEGYLIGGDLTAAETMCLFSVQYIFFKDLCAGRKIVEWPFVERWVRRCEEREAYKRAVEKTGFKL